MSPASDSKNPTPEGKSESAGATQRLHVGHSIRQRRLDKYLHGRLSNLSRSFIQTAIKQGAVKVNDKICKQSQKLSPGDIIDFTPPEPPSKDIPPEDIPLDIIYEDQELIILNKQSDMIVHPARGNTHGTLVNALTFYSDELSSGLGEFRPGIVHRLDRNTTGIMIVTKNDSAQWRIAKQFENRQVKKTYLAIVHGTPELTADRINAALGVHPRVREKYAVRPDSGKEAVTFYEVLEAFRGYSVLKMTPKTGRTHQIRVHLAYIKHPIVGDTTYGGKLVYDWQLADVEPNVAEPIINRVSLHAFAIEFRHPAKDKIMKFEAPLPQDMRDFLDALRKYRRI